MAFPSLKLHVFPTPVPPTLNYTPSGTHQDPNCCVWIKHSYRVTTVNVATSVKFSQKKYHRMRTHVLFPDLGWNLTLPFTVLFRAPTSWGRYGLLTKSSAQGSAHSKCSLTVSW